MTTLRFATGSPKPRGGSRVRMFSLALVVLGVALLSPSILRVSASQEGSTTDSGATDPSTGNPSAPNSGATDPSGASASYAVPDSSTNDPIDSGATNSGTSDTTTGNPSASDTPTSLPGNSPNYYSNGAYSTETSSETSDTSASLGRATSSGSSSEVASNTLHTTSTGATFTSFGGDGFETLKISSTNSEGDNYHPLYVDGITKIQLRVLQNVFGCGACADNTMVSIHTAEVSSKFIQMQECGGRRQFLEGSGTSSTTCDTYYHCAVVSEAIDATTGATGASFSGLIYLNVTTSGFVTTMGSTCRDNFQARLYYQYAAGTKNTRASPFRLKRKKDERTKLRYSLAFPTGVAYGDRLQEVFPGLTTTAYTQLQAARYGTLLQGVSIGPLSDPMQVFTYTDETIFSTLSLDNHNITSGNVTFACVLDWTDNVGLGPGGQYYCLITIPEASNYFSIDVSQTDFALHDMAYSLVDPSGVATAIDGSCGATKGFSGQQGESGSCNTYQSCAGRYLYFTPNPASKYTTLNISFPASMRSLSCDLTFSALVLFESRWLPEIAACVDQFFCTADLSCTKSVCDGVKDCSDAADELGCWDWSVVYKGSIFRFDEVNSTEIQTVQSFAECRKFATIAATNSFALDQTTLSCVIYRENNTRVAFADPKSYLVSNDTTQGYDLYVNEEINDVDFQLCSSYLHCSGNGALVPPVDYLRGCRCVCNFEFTGEACAERKDLAGLDRHVAFVTYSETDGSLPPVDDLTDSLIQSEATKKIKDGGYEPFNSTTATLEFTVTSRDPSAQEAYRQALLTNATLVGIRANLLAKVGQNYSLQAIGVASPTARSVALDGCVFGLVGVNCVPNVAENAPVTSVLIKAQSMENVEIKYRTLNGAGGRRQSGSGSGSGSSSVGSPQLTVPPGTSGNISFNCTGSDVVTSLNDDGCTITTCNLRFGMSIDLAALHVTGSPINNTPDDCLVSYEVSAKEAVTVTLKEETEPIVKADPRPVWQLVVIIVLLVGALALLAGGLKAHTTYLDGVHDWAIEFALKAKTVAGIFISEGFADRQYNQLLARGELKGTKSYTGTKLMVGSMVFFIGGGLLLTFYAMSETTHTNYSIYFETYRDSYCNVSEFSPMPFQFIRLESLNRCEPIPFPTSETFFARGECKVNTVRLGIANGKTSCLSSSYMEIPRGGCQPAAELGLSGIEGFVKVTCMKTENATRRSQELNALVGNAPPGRDLLTPAAPRSDLLPTTVTDPIDNATVAAWPFLSQGATSMSTFPHLTTETMIGYYSKDFFNGEYEGRRILTHYEHSEVVELSVAGGSIEAPITRAFEKLADPHVNDMSNLNESLVGLPTQSGYLLGNIYNSFESDTPRNDKQAGTASHRYFSLRDSQFDLSQYFLQKSEVQFGFTISMWLRANSKSVGFPFIMADGYEDSSLQQSVIVNRLLDILRTGTGTWFTEEDWNVYLGLYVHGPTKTLSLVQAHTNYPTENVRALTAEEQVIPGVIKHTWDLELIGFSRLLNGLWHKVDLIFFMQNERIEVRLAVDSVTRRSTPGFSVCLALPTRPIKATATRAQNVSNIAIARLYDDGVMYTGYFSGGVGKLQVKEEKAEQAQIANQGTATMKSLSQISYISFHILGGLLITAGAIFLLFSLAHTREVLLARTKRTMDMREIGMSLYYAMYINEPVVDGNGAIMQPLSYLEACHWLSLDDDGMAAVLEEILIADGYGLASRTLTRVIYALGDTTYVSDNKALPPIESWDRKVIDKMADEEARLAVLRLTDPSSIKLDSKIRLHLQKEKAKKFAEKGKPKGRVAKYVGATADGLGSAAAFDHSLYQMLMPVLQLFQIIGIYMTSIEFPNIYEDTLGRLFEIFSFDLMQFPEIPTLVTPILQFGLGLFVLVAMVYTGVVDNQVFKQHVAMYAQRRDEIEADEALTKKHHDAEVAAAQGLQDKTTKTISQNPESPKEQGGDVEVTATKRLTEAGLLSTSPRSSDGNPPKPKPDPRGDQVVKASHLDDLNMRIEGMEPTQDRLPTNMYQDFLIPPRERSRIDVFFQPVEDRRTLRREFDRHHRTDDKNSTTTPPPHNLDTVEEKGEGREEADRPKSPTKVRIMLDDMDVLLARHAGDPNVIQKLRLKVANLDEDTTILNEIEEGHENDEGEPVLFTTATVFAEDRDTEKQTKWIDVCPMELEAMKMREDEANGLEPEESEALLRQPSNVAEEEFNSHGTKVALQRGEELRIVGNSCPAHPWRKLGAMQSTDIYPFNYQPTCCIVDNGIPCGGKVGIIYNCGLPCRDDKPDPVWHMGNNAETEESKAIRSQFDDMLDEEKAAAVAAGKFNTEADWEDHDQALHQYKCHYAVCEQHFKASVVDEIKSKVIGKARSAKQRGKTWLLTLAMVGITTAIYTPFMKTSIMVLSCHPYFQCEFTNCWGHIDLKFALAVFLTLISLVFFGLGLPFGQMYLLWKRKSWLETAMCTDEYKGKYLERADGPYDDGNDEEDDPEREILNRADALEEELLKNYGDNGIIKDTNHCAFLEGQAEAVKGLTQGRPGCMEFCRRLYRGMKGTIPLDAQWTPINNGLALNEFFLVRKENDFANDLAKIKRLRKNAWRHGVVGGSVSTVDWRNFLSSDESGLSLLYLQLEFDWMFLTPPLLFFKFALICPSVLLEPDSLIQLAGVGLMEFGFAVFVFMTNPYRSPWTDLMIHIGSIHQLFFLGLQAFNFVERSKGKPDLGYYMVACTGTYLLIIAIFIFVLTIWPLISKRRQEKKISNKLKAFGLYPVSQALLYKKPGIIGFRISHPKEEFRPWILAQQRISSYLESGGKYIQSLVASSDKIGSPATDRSPQANTNPLNAPSVCQREPENDSSPVGDVDDLVLQSLENSENPAPDETTGVAQFSDTVSSEHKAEATTDNGDASTEQEVRATSKEREQRGAAAAAKEEDAEVEEYE